MTGYTVHTGTNKKFADGWERVFGKAAGKRSPAKAKSPGKTATKKSRRK
ncbi:MAG: hypothetical protein KF774_08560 [Planctomyces sp.]|nr:hypothetical protein [Planctomyces sp.]